MAVRVQQRHQRFDRADRRVVLVLPDRGDDLALARRELVVRQRRRHDDVAEQRAAPPRSPRRGSVQTSEKQMAGDGIVSVMPRLSSSSAMSRGRSRAPCRDRSRATAATSAPGASGGSQIDPARIARLIVTAGVVCVSLAMTTAPLSSTVARRVGRGRAVKSKRRGMRIAQRRASDFELRRCRQAAARTSRWCGWTASSTARAARGDLVRASPRRSAPAAA